MLEVLRGPAEQAAAGLAVRPGGARDLHSRPGQGTAIRELISDGTAAVLCAGDDLGDLPAMQEVNAWAERGGRPKLTVAVSPGGRGPLADQAGMTVPDPQGFLALLRQLTADAG